MCKHRLFAIFQDYVQDEKKIHWKDILLSGQTHFEVWRSALEFGRIYFIIWTNTFWSFYKYILEIVQMYFGIWTNTFWNLDTNTLEFGQIHISRSHLVWQRRKIEAVLPFLESVSSKGGLPERFIMKVKVFWIEKLNHTEGGKWKCRSLNLRWKWKYFKWKDEIVRKEESEIRGCIKVKVAGICAALSL